MLSLTIDDAPMVVPDVSRLPGAAPDPQAMDAIREGLQSCGIRHCVAFVVSATAERDAGPLERWLAAGYELGNHTHNHVPAHESSQADFFRSVERCHALLERLGAFAAGRTKWFRFPQLGYGGDARARVALRTGLRALGYAIAHGSTDLYDHAYEGALGRALSSRDEQAAAAIGRRFLRSARFSLWQSRRLVARHFGADVPLVAYAHFGRVFRQGMVPLLADLSRSAAVWCPLELALRHDFYRRLDEDEGDASGLATAGLPRAFAWRVTRKLARLSRPLADRLWIRRLGPSLPALIDG